MKFREGSDKASLMNRYRKSIYFDLLVCFVPTCVLIFTVTFIEKLSEIFDSAFVFLICLVIFGSYLFSDKLFTNQSLGKRIYKIEVRNQSGINRVALRSLIHRRILEAYIRPSTGENFEKVIERIDKKTGTHITRSKVLKTEKTRNPVQKTGGTYSGKQSK